MTLDEAIYRYTSNAYYVRASGDLQGYMEFKQLVEWLCDYKRLKEQEPCEDAISREKVCDYIAEFINHEYSTDAECEMVDLMIKGIQHMPPVNPQEPSGDAVSRDFQIGDEVRIIGSDPIYDDCDVGWVIRNASERVKTMYVMRNDGSADEENKAEWYKTGRHNAMLAEVIKQLPFVNPQEPTGHWIIMFDRYIKCSECGHITKTESPDIYNFCMVCGAKMVEAPEKE